MALTLRVWFGFWRFGFSFFELGGFWSSGVGFSFERTAGTIREFVLRGNQQSLTVFGAPARGVLGLRGPEKNIECGPSAFEAHAAWGLGNERGGLSADLRQRVMNADLVQADFQDGIGWPVRMRLAFLDAGAPSVRVGGPVLAAGNDRGSATQCGEARLCQAEHEVAIRLPRIPRDREEPKPASAITIPSSGICTNRSRAKAVSETACSPYMAPTEGINAAPLLNS